jgi:hypothetical protein
MNYTREGETFFFMKSVFTRITALAFVALSLQEPTACERWSARLLWKARKGTRINVKRRTLPWLKLKRQDPSAPPH